MWCEILKLATWRWPRSLQGQLVIWRLVLLVTKPSTKFEACSFSHSKDISWGENSKVGQVTLTTPLSGTVCHWQAGTCHDKSTHQIWSAYLHPLPKYERHRKVLKMVWFEVVSGYPRSLTVHLLTLVGLTPEPKVTKRGDDLQCT